ncbi:MAG: hypothetical protein Q8O03_08950 [Nanoarchaeota archaeon]|nr:hypothetical protein [Nanoarchaeota archaeon]
MKKLLLFLVIILILPITYAQSGNVTKPFAVSEPDTNLNGRNIESLEPDIIFDVTNSDPNHKLEGYLSCPIPNDMAIAQVEGAEYLKGFITTSRFVLDTAPHSKSIEFKIERLNKGIVFLNCSLNYALFKEDKGYVRDVISREGVTYAYRYNPTPTYLQKEKIIKLGKEPLPPEPTRYEKIIDLIERYKSVLTGVLGALILILAIYFLSIRPSQGLEGTHSQIKLIEDEKNKKRICTGYKSKYYRLEEKNFPQWAINEFRASVNRHLPSKGTVFRYKGKHHRYLIVVGSLIKNKDETLLPYAVFYRRRYHHPSNCWCTSIGK